MNWNAELDAVMNVARSVSAEHLPRFLGDLEFIRVIAWQRLAVQAPKGQQSSEEFLDVHEAARRLGVSPKFLYTHHHQFRFTRHVGRRLRFSATDLDYYMRRNGAKASLNQ